VSATGQHGGWDLIESGPPDADHVVLALPGALATARAWVVFGDHGDVGLTDEERRELEACTRVTLVTIHGSGHDTLNEKPAQIADVILEMVSAAGGQLRRAS
jgi:pimeloyl-ACP methyl ester carboxylesterase